MVEKSALDGLRIERPVREERRRGTLWVAAALFIVVAAAVTWALARGGVKRVRVAQAHAISSSTSSSAVLNASGYVTARRQATVSAKVTGKVAEVFVEEGMHVREGQELARLDAAYAAKGLRLAEAEAAASASALEETRVRIRQAQLDYDRAARLASSQISSRADADRARAELDAARARLVAQNDQLSTARRQIDLQRQSVDDTIVRAPFDGVVVSKDAQPGEMVSPISAGGGFTRTGICTIVDMSSLEIEVDVNEAYINRVHPNQRVEAVLDAYPDWKIPAHVITAVPTANREKATVRVRIAFDQRDARILPEMGVKVTFITDEPSSPAATIEVPRSVVRRDGERDVVFVVRDGRVERRAVRVGSVENEVARILSGVADGESVVVDAPEDLKDGERVVVKDEGKR